MPAAAPKKPPTRMSIIGFLIIMGCIASILLFPPPPIKPEDVASRLREFSDVLARDAAKVGRQAALSYGAITIGGTGYDTYVIIKNLHFSVSAKMGATDGNLTLDTDKVTVNLDPITRQRLVFKFTDPITLMENGKRKTVMTPATPLKFGYLETDNPKFQFDRNITIRFPSSLKLASGDNVGGSQPPLVINYDGMPTISIKHDAKDNKWVASTEWNDIILQSENVQHVDVGAVAGDFEEKIAGDNKQAGDFTFSISDFIRRENGKAVATCSLSSNINYSSTESLIAVFGVSDKAAVTAKLNKMIIACDDFSMKLEGDLAIQPGDDLPSGAVTVMIDDTGAFLANKLFSEQTRNELTAALPKITGQPLEKLTKISIPIKRVPGGLLMLGDVTSKEADITGINQWFPTK